MGGWVVQGMGWVGRVVVDTRDGVGGVSGG